MGYRYNNNGSSGGNQGSRSGYANMVDTNGNLPRGTVVGSGALDMMLPLGAIIEYITISVPLGATAFTNNGWEFYVDNYESTPFRFITAKPQTSDNPSLGFLSYVDLWYRCDTDAKRHLVASSSAAVTEAVKGEITVQYLILQ